MKLALMLLLVFPSALALLATAAVLEHNAGGAMATGYLTLLWLANLPRLWALPKEPA